MLSNLTNQNWLQKASNLFSNNEGLIKGVAIGTVGAIGTMLVSPIAIFGGSIAAIPIALTILVTAPIIGHISDRLENHTFSAETTEQEQKHDVSIAEIVTEELNTTDTELNTTRTTSPMLATKQQSLQNAEINESDTEEFQECIETVASNTEALQKIIKESKPDTEKWEDCEETPFVLNRISQLEKNGISETRFNSLLKQSNKALQ